MTPKQTLFVLEYLKDLNATQAANRAGYRHPNIQSAQLITNKEISEKINAEMRSRVERIRLDADTVVSRLELEATNPNNSASARIRALELLGKHLGIFSPEKHSISISSGFFADA